MEYSSQPIKNKPSRVQRETLAVVEELELEQGAHVHPRDVCNKLGGYRLKTIENRLQTYARKGWLHAKTDAKRDTPTLYSVTDQWIDLIDACDNDVVEVVAGNRIKYGPCTRCERKARLTRFQSQDLCNKCLANDWDFKHGDDNHLLVKSNWDL